MAGAGSGAGPMGTRSRHGGTDGVDEDDGHHDAISRQASSANIRPPAQQQQQQRQRQRLQADGINAASTSPRSGSSVSSSGMPSRSPTAPAQQEARRHRDSRGSALSGAYRDDDSEQYGEHGGLNLDDYESQRRARTYEGRRNDEHPSDDEQDQEVSDDDDDRSPLIPTRALPPPSSSFSSRAPAHRTRPLSSKAKGKQRALDVDAGAGAHADDGARNSSSFLKTMPELQRLRRRQASGSVSGSADGSGASSPTIRVPEFQAYAAADADAQAWDAWLAAGYAAAGGVDGDGYGDGEGEGDLGRPRRSSFDAALLTPAPWRHAHDPFALAGSPGAGDSSPSTAAGAASASAGAHGLAAELDARLSAAAAQRRGHGRRHHAAWREARAEAAAAAAAASALDARPAPGPLGRAFVPPAAESAVPPGAAGGVAAGGASSIAAPAAGAAPGTGRRAAQAAWPWDSAPAPLPLPLSRPASARHHQHGHPHAHHGAGRYLHRLHRHPHAHAYAHGHGDGHAHPHAHGRSRSASFGSTPRPPPPSAAPLVGAGSADPAAGAAAGDAAGVDALGAAPAADALQQPHLWPQAAVSVAVGGGAKEIAAAVGAEGEGEGEGDGEGAAPGDGASQPPQRPPPVPTLSTSASASAPADGEQDDTPAPTRSSDRWSFYSLRTIRRHTGLSLGGRGASSDEEEVEDGGESGTRGRRGRKRGRRVGRWFRRGGRRKGKGEGQATSNFFTLFLDGAQPADWCLLLVGFLAAIASGVPLPIIGVLFGELIDGFNSVSCGGAGANAQGTSQALASLVANVARSAIAGSGSPHALPPEQQAEFIANVVSKVKLILAAAAANFVLIWIYTVCWSLIGERIVRRLRYRYLSSVLRQEMAFFDLAKPGEIATRLSADLLTIQVGTSEKCGIMLSSLSYFFTSFIVAFIKLPVLAAQLLSLLPAFAIISLVGSKYVGRFTTRTSTHLSHASSLATEALGNLAVVQIFNAEEKLTRLYAKHLEAARKSGLRKAIAASCMLGCLFFVGYSANSLAFYSGSKIIAQRLRSGDTSESSAGVGSVYTVIFLLLDASFIIGQIAPYMQTFSQAGAAGRGLFSVIYRPSKIDATSTSIGQSPDASALSGISVSFRNVTFSYPSRKSQKAADGLDLEIEEGQKVGICGPSGSGKSTVVALTCRFYDPDDGQVLINGIPATDLSPRWLRSQIGIVSQDPVLFDGTILQAIALGLHGSIQHEELWPALRALSTGEITEHNLGEHAHEMAQIKALVEHAAELANARGFIEELEDGYSTRVGEGGARMSGGQKMRISLARAIVKRPKLLICDEATAALDAESEKLVQEAFDQAAEGRTVISVAHRLASIKNHDKIVVVSKGKVLEQGSHDELIAQKGAYYALAAAQDIKQESKGDEQNEKESDGPDDAAPKNGFRKSSSEATSMTAVDPPKADLRSSRKRPSVWVRLAAACRPELVFAAIGLFTSVVIGSAYSGEAFIFGHVIDALNPCRGISSIRSNADFFALMFFVLALVELFSYSINGSAFGKMAEALLYRLRRLSFLSLLRQKQSWFDTDDRSPSTIVSSLAADAAALGGLTSTVMGTVCAIGVNLIVGLVVSFIVSWRIAVVLIWTVPLMMAAGYMRLKVLADFQRRHATAYRGANAIAIEAVNNIGTVQGLGSQSDVADRFQHSLIEPYQKGLRHIFVGNVFLAGALSLSYFIYGFAYYWGSRQVAEGHATQTDFFIVLPALLFSAQASGQLLSFSSEFAHAQSSAQHLFSVIDESEASQDLSTPESFTSKSRKEADVEAAPESGGSTPEGPMAINCENVVFSYPSRKDPVLRGVTFDVQPGNFVALVGPSGSGKSTFFALLTKLYDPTSGAIRINNRAIQDIPAERLRRDIAIVPQEPTLFYGSVRFNVALGARDEHASPSADDENCVPLEDVIDACKRANIHDTIMSLPEGYDTLVGLKGGQLSGGQRQRLALARALIRKPKLLLLDEASSALDAESERIFQETLHGIVQSRTCTIVSINHRMATIKDVDYLYIFNRGTIVACGSHAHLMRTNERFRAMVSHQSLL